MKSISIQGEAYPVPEKLDELSRDQLMFYLEHYLANYHRFYAPGAGEEPQ